MGRGEVALTVYTHLSFPPGQVTPALLGFLACHPGTQLLSLLWGVGGIQEVKLLLILCQVQPFFLAL